MFWVCVQAGKAEIRSLFHIVFQSCSMSDRGSAHIEIPSVGNEGKTPAPAVNGAEQQFHCKLCA